MKLRQDLYDASERRGVESGIAGKAATATRDAPKPQLGSRAIIRRATFLSANGNVPSPTELERIMGENDLVDEFYLQRGLIAANPVCRIVLRSAGGRELGYATGFLVSPRILLTNWHVLPDVAGATNAVAEFNYLLDYRGNPSVSTRFALRPDRFHHANQALDFALVCVDDTPLTGSATLASFGYHQLIAADGKISEKEWITIIQHPSGKPRQFSIRDNQLLAKRDDGFLWYASDTAPGSSGAPAFNDSFQVVALHHMGKAARKNGLFLLRDGRTVASIDGLDDTEIVWEANEGVRVSFICKAIDDGLSHTSPYYLELRRAMEQGGVMSAPLSANVTGGFTAFPGATRLPGAAIIDGGRIPRNDRRCDIRWRNRRSDQLAHSGGRRRRHNCARGARVAWSFRHYGRRAEARAGSKRWLRPLSRPTTATEGLRRGVSRRQRAAARSHACARRRGRQRLHVAQVPEFLGRHAQGATPRAHHGVERRCKPLGQGARARKGLLAQRLDRARQERPGIVGHRSAHPRTIPDPGFFLHQRRSDIRQGSHCPSRRRLLGQDVRGSPTRQWRQLPHDELLAATAGVQPRDCRHHQLGGSGKRLCCRRRKSSA